VPLVLAVADELRQLLPNVRFVIPVAPGQTPQSLAAYAHPKLNPDMAVIYGTSATLEQTNLGSHFVTPFGTTVQLWTRFPAYSVLANCDLCLTTVGANTAELAYLGVPMVVAIPTNKLEAMRAWDGIPGLLARLPGLGTWIARLINTIALRWLGYLAWPNIWAGREVVPELRGHLRPAQVAEQVRALLADPERRQQMQRELQQLGGRPGAAQAIVQLVAQQLSKS
jgi:lipid-A-disaccharide synthase